MSNIRGYISSYTLDGNISLKSNDEIKITINSYFDPENDVIGYFENQDEAPTIITKTYSSIDNPNYVYYEDHTSVFKGVCKIFHDTGKIMFYSGNSYPTYSQGEDNIIVEFSTQDLPVVDNYKVLTFGGRTLIVYDPKNEMVIYSEYDNISYFPLSNYVTVKTNSAYPIGDSTIALFTDEGVSYLKRNTLALSEKEVKYAYSYIEGKPGVTCIAPESIKTLANDILFLSDVGVHALSFGDNITTNERYALERSAFINSKLLKHKDLSNAKAITYKNKYYLAVDGCVYIADARYKTSARDQDMNDTFNYEWWYWDNMPVKEWVILDNELHFISTNNKIAKFTNARVDETLHYMTYGDWTGEELTNKIQFNGNNKHLLKDGNKVLVRDKTFYIKTDKDTQYNAQFYLVDSNDEIVDIKDEVFGNFMESFYICDLNNVVSEWYTPILNMGTNLYSKNLIGSTLTFEPDVEGSVKFGYLTRRSAEPKDKISSLRPTNGLDLEDLDFTDFSFSVGFACSRTLKTRARNYNYIQFRIVSEDNKDCALNNFVVTYTIGRKNKGVR